MLPSLFISHGSPMMALEDTETTRFLAGLGQELARPSAILAISAHWETVEPTLSAPPANATIHDFHGFPPALYRLRYPAPAAPQLAAQAAALLAAAGLAAATDRARGLDHGAWVPLSLMYPAADIPVAQLSIQSHLGPAHHHRLGLALRPLRAAGVLVLGTGSFTHNLRLLRPAEDAPPLAQSVEFAAWMARALAEQRLADLLAYRSLAPHAVLNHPTDEHLLPFFVSLGAGSLDAGSLDAGSVGAGGLDAGSPGWRVEHLHARTSHAALRMDAFAFQ